MKSNLFALLMLPLSTACSSGPIGQAALDDEVRRLCAIDGGIKVYETVKLPGGKFDKWGHINVQSKNYAKATDEYYSETNIQYFQKGNPSLERANVKIVRQNDEKVLGESIRYGRGGGDLPGPWHGSSFDCPSISEAEGKLESSIFFRDDTK